MVDCIASFNVHPFRPLKSNHHVMNPLQSTTKFRIRCSGVKTGDEAEAKDYYHLLGVSVESTPKEIKEAYRRLQKIYHPDIAGQKGHEYTLQLNEAYRALMRRDLRRRYDMSSGKKREGFESNFSGLGCSSWNGPIRPQALFVDENRCIGCRECVHHASKTFAMDESLGSARVRVSIESCPTNCIHWVESQDLPMLEFLTRPQPKEAHGVFGGGWERARDVFSTAKSFKKQLKRQHEQQEQAPNGVDERGEETNAQAKARYDASVKLRMESILDTWDGLREFFSPKSKIN